MEDRSVAGSTLAHAGPTDPVVARAEALVGWLQDPPPACGDSTRIERLAALERLSAAVEAAKLSETVAFHDSQIEAQRAAGVPARRLGDGISAQVGLACRMSPAQAARYLATCRVIAADLPAVRAAMCAGDLAAWTATLVVRETTALSAEHRRAVDAELAPRLPSLTPHRAATAARRIAYRLDPNSVLRRGRTARADRRVSLRPAPDTMALLTGFLPVEQGVAAYAALDRHARSLRATGDPRTLGQIMADTLVERVTGQSSATAVPIEVGVTISLDSLLGGDEPGRLAGRHGPVPSALVRALLHGSGRPDREADPDRAGAAAFVRRLITDPVDHSLLWADPRRRRFPTAAARYIASRDQTCRMPGCDAPIRHLDHVVAVTDGGLTTIDNGQGLCERDNYLKQLPGWSHRRDPTESAHVVVVTTPTGHQYRSRAPAALGP